MVNMSNLSIDHYCFLVHERNEINRLRRKFNAKRNNLCNSKNYKKDWPAQMAYIDATKKYEYCKDVIRSFSRELEKMAKDIGIKNDWGGANGTIRGFELHDMYYDDDFIRKKHKEYMAECILLQITIYNPYNKEDL